MADQLTTTSMSAAEFLAWAERVEPRYQLVDGVPVATAPEVFAHGVIKGEIFARLRDAIRSGKLPCRAMVDSVGVQVGEDTIYIPDVLVFCTPAPPPEARLVPDPMIIVEILSESTQITDTVHKLEGYFRLASLRHYVIVDGGRKIMVHHARHDDGTILTRIVHDGTLSLNPPGLAILDIFDA